VPAAMSDIGNTAEVAFAPAVLTYTFNNTRPIELLDLTSSLLATFTEGKKTGLLQQTIVDRALFLEPEERHSHPRQRRLNLEAAKLSEGFFEQLRRHPVPIEEAAVKVLNNKSAGLDCYLWLAYRLHVLIGNVPVSWPALKGQFGTAFTKLAGFKSWFLAPDGPLALALSVYPDAKVAVEENGVVLKPSKPPVPPRLMASTPSRS
jgi:hypothetical protein